MNIKKYSTYVGNHLNNGTIYHIGIGYYEEPIAVYFKDQNLYIFTKEAENSTESKKLEICVVDANNFTTFIQDDFYYLDKYTISNSYLSNISSGNNIQMNLNTITDTYLFFARVEKTKQQLREEKITELITNEK